jgi:hypothetical protein
MRPARKAAFPRESTDNFLRMAWMRYHLTCSL